MAEFTVARVSVKVVPDADGFHKDLAKQTRVKPIVVDVVPKLDAAKAVTEAKGAARQVQSTFDRIQAKAKLDADTALVNAKIADVKRRLDELSRAKPSPTIDADITAARAKITAINADLTRLRSLEATPKVNADIAAAEAKITHLNSRIAELNAKKASFSVDADVAKARADLATLERQRADLDGKRIHLDVNVDTDRVTRGLTAVGGAAAGAGSAVSGFGQLGNMAMNQVAAGALRSAGTFAALIPLAGLAGGAIVAAAGMAAAALAAIPAAVAGAAAGIATLGFAFSGVGDAVKALGDADTASASASSSAAQQRQAAMQRVKSAVQSLSDAQTNADRTAIQGRERVRSAELALGAAQRQAQAAQESLNRAREEAREAIEDLALSLRGAVLSEERASLSLEQAQLRLNEAIAAGEPAVQIRDYELAVREAALSVDEARERTGDLRQESANWARTGIEGSAGVVAAQRQVQDANAAVAEAQRNIGVAVREAGWANADAQKQVARAVDELRQAHEAQGVAGVAAADKVAEAMAKLSPAGRQFAQFLHNELMPALDQIRFKAQEGLLPGLEASLRRLIPLAPMVGDGFFSIGQSISRLASGITDVVTSTEGVDAIRNALAGSAEFIDIIRPGIQSVVRSMLRIAGMREIYQILGDLVGGLSQKFADFLDRMRESGDLTEGLRILKDVAFGLADAFFWFLEAASKFLQGAAPGIQRFIEGFKSSLDDLDWYALGQVFGWILDGIGLLMRGLFQTWDIMIPFWQAVGDVISFTWHNVIKPIWDALAWLVTNIIAPAILWFWHEVMVPAWDAIGAAISFVWNTFIKPAWDALVWLVRDIIAPAILWFWHEVMVPAWNAIGDVISFVWNTFIKPPLDALAWLIREVIIPIIQLLWHEVISPIFTWIGDKIQSAWVNFIRPAFDGIKSAFEAVGGAIRWVWDNVFWPVFTWVGDKVQDAWQNFVRPAFDGIGGGFQAVGDWIMRVWNEKIKPVIDWMVDGFNRAKSAVERAIPGGSNGAPPAPTRPGGAHRGGLVPTTGFATGGLAFGFQRGGRAPGRTDTVPAMLTPREFIMTRLATANLGPNIMYQLMGLLERNPQIANLLAGIIKALSAGGAAAGLGALLAQHAGGAGFGGVGAALGFARGGLVGFQAGGAVGGAPAAGGAAPAAQAGSPLDPAQLQAAAAAADLLRAAVDLLNISVQVLTLTVTTFITAALVPLQLTIMTQTLPAISALQQQMLFTQTVSIPQLQLAFQLLLENLIIIWQQIVFLITNSVLLMSQQFFLLQTNSQNAWNAIVLHTQTSVNTITGPIFGALVAGMANIRLQAQQTADFWGQQMDSMRAKAADPIRWIMLFPLGPPGIAASWNTLDDQFKLGKRINPPAPNFAEGGLVTGPGTGTSDSITARLSKGEFVVREKVTRRHRHFLEALNAGQAEAKQAAGGPRARMPGFVLGGIVGGQEVARTMHGKRYVWGGGGIGGTDCSGFMAFITRGLRGEANPYRRIGTTSTFPWPGFAPGLHSAFAVGNVRGSHMRGTLAGVNVEAGGSHRTSSYGGPAAGVPYGQNFHLPQAGGVFAPGGPGGGGAMDPTPIVDAAFKRAYELNDDIVKHFGDSKYVTGAQTISRAAIDAVRLKALEQLMTMFGGLGGYGAGAPFYVAEICRAAKVRGLGVDGATLGVATALVESNLRMYANRSVPASLGFPHDAVGSDHDSVGLFQQRQAGWGTIEQRMNPFASAGLFFDKLMTFNWRAMDPGAACQRVQVSAFPGKYSTRMGEARGLVGVHGGPFDDGGVARGIGLWWKGTGLDERVLPPVETQSYDVLTHLVGRSGIKVDGLSDGGSGGPIEMNVYDVNDQLIGRMRAEAATEVDTGLTRAAARIRDGRRVP